MEFNDIIRNAASLPTTEIAADVNKALPPTVAWF